MKISILVPVYNAQRYIERCARRLFEQTYDDLEYVFVNDCSPDKSIEILKTTLNEYPHREKQVRIINHHKNRGVAASRSTLLANATGDYILWIDADDFIENETIELLVTKAKTTNADLIYFGAAWYNRSKGIKKIPKSNVNNSHDFITCVLSGSIPPVLWSNFMKRDIFEKHNINFIEGLDMGEDFLALIKFAYYSKTITNSEKILYYQDISDRNSLTRPSNETKAEKYLNITLKNLDDIEFFFRGKLDISEYLKKNRLNIYLKKIYFACLKNDKADYKRLKKQIKPLISSEKHNMKFAYLFYATSNNYFLDRIWTYILFYVKKLYKLTKA